MSQDNSAVFCKLTHTAACTGRDMIPIIHTTQHQHSVDVNTTSKSTQHQHNINITLTYDHVLYCKQPAARSIVQHNINTTGHYKCLMLFTYMTYHIYISYIYDMTHHNMTTYHIIIYDYDIYDYYMVIVRVQLFHCCYTQCTVHSLSVHSSVICTLMSVHSHS